MSSIRTLSPPFVLPRARLDDLFERLRARGYRVVGPRVRDGVIVLDTVESSADLPVGYTDEHAPGRYRLRRRNDDAVFGFVVGPDSFKRTFLVPVQRLFRARRDGDRVRFSPEPVDTSKVALVGARGCDLAAIETQDEILAEGAHADPFYVARREAAFIVAVSCSESRSSCFCTSLGTGPRPTRGFDLSLTELLDGPHRFLVEIGSAEALEIATELGLSTASEQDQDAAAGIALRTSRGMERQLDTQGLREVLLSRLEHPHWQDVGSRCLACTNCTAVCPTCFCVDIVDKSSLDGESHERTRQHDSCFSADYSAVHGHPVRNDVAARYRQWLTHKLATWIDQFGRSGCVGCGRCITWCPAAIDLTREVARLRDDVSLETDP